MLATRMHRLGPVETQKVRDVTDSLFESARPAEALVALMRMKDDPNADTFARYAGHILADAGLGHVAGMPFFSSLVLGGPQDGRLARIAIKGPMPAHARSLLSQIEDAVSRIVALRDAVEDAALHAQPKSDERIFISFQGVDRIPDRPATRSALVPLPPIGLTEKPTLEFFNELEWRLLDHVASNGRAVFQNSLRPNLRQSVLGAYAPNGSDWDVRTRLASILDGLELSPRLSCRFDCNAQLATVYAVFEAPCAGSLPRCFVPGPGQDLAALGSNLGRARAAYTMRLACLVACGCFGAGHRIERAYVTAEDVGGQPYMEFAFDRHGFVHSALAAIDSGELAHPSLRFRPEAIAKTLAPRWFAGGDDVRKGTRPRDFDERANRTQPKSDSRPLPENLATLFGATAVSDFDATYFGGHEHLITEALRDSSDSVITAVAELESVTHLLEQTATPPNDNAGARPLYYGSPFSRIATPLLADEMAVGCEAQDFLDVVAADCPAEATPRNRTVEFFRAPSALFHAYMGLSDLYQRMGDFSGAGANADRCMALGPTTASAYFRKADILAEQTRYAEAANVLISGLSIAISKRDCALLYYHLGLALWRMGREGDAAAVQVYASSLSGEFADKARAVVTSLRKKPDSPVIVHASARAAAAEMRRNRIPIRPNDEANALIAQAALGLSCANAPQAAAPFADALASLLAGDRIIVSACRSLRNGTRHPDALKA